MNKKRLLYVSNNNGTDTRIRKELKTLSEVFDIQFLGMSYDEETSLTPIENVNYKFVKGRSNNPLSYLKLLLLIFKVRFSQPKFHSAHLIDETCLISCFIGLIGIHKVLDIFDSIFLKRLQFLKNSIVENLIHSIPQVILVTDDNRKTLISASKQKKVVVIPNYPFLKDQASSTPFNNEFLNIAYVGSIEKARGTEFIKGILTADKENKVKIHMIGWVYDEESKSLSTDPKTEFYGVVEQKKALEIVGKCDYLLSMYEPKSLNNINASPNKIFDGILQDVPVIINREVKMSTLVEKLNSGYILDDYFTKDYTRVLNDLINNQKSYFKEPLNKRDFTWEGIESDLINAHKN